MHGDSGMGVGFHKEGNGGGWEALPRTPLTEGSQSWDAAGVDGTPRVGWRVGSEASRKPEELR